MQLTSCLINWGHFGTPSIHLQLTAKAGSWMNRDQPWSLWRYDVAYVVVTNLFQVLQGVLDRDSPISAQVEGRIILVNFSLFVNQNYHINNTSSGKIICHVDNFYLRLPFIRWRMGWTWMRLESAWEEGCQLACQKDFYSLRLCSLLISEMPSGGVVRFPSPLPSNPLPWVGQLGNLTRGLACEPACQRGRSYLSK